MHAQTTGSTQLFVKGIRTVPYRTHVQMARKCNQTPWPQLATAPQDRNQWKVLNGCHPEGTQQEATVQGSQSFCETGQ